MSKESYARGFCKAAQAAGVDPVALAKYAQDIDTHYGATGGKAPEGVPGADSGQIPVYYGRDGDVGKVSYVGELANAKDIASGPVADASMNVPWFKNWYDAHTNALAHITRGMGDVNNKHYFDELSPSAKKVLAPAYHQRMFLSTNTVPKIKEQQWADLLKRKPSIFEGIPALMSKKK